MRVLLTALVSFCSACGTMPRDTAPGTPLGVYRLEANADMTSSCTEILNATPRPWTFEVTLRREGEQGFWISGPEPIVGTISSKGTIAFKQTIPVPVRAADKARELGPCTILRTDDFAGQLAGAPTTSTGVASFSGTLRYSYQVAEGSDCRDVVGPVAPERPKPLFANLPCDARFAVTAVRTGDPKPR